MLHALKTSEKPSTPSLAPRDVPIDVFQLELLWFTAASFIFPLGGNLFNTSPALPITSQLIVAPTSFHFNKNKTLVKSNPCSAVDMPFVFKVPNTRTSKSVAKRSKASNFVRVIALFRHRFVFAKRPNVESGYKSLFDSLRYPASPAGHVRFIKVNDQSLEIK